MTRWTLTYDGVEPFTIPADDLAEASRDAFTLQGHTGLALLSVVRVEETPDSTPLITGIEKLTALGLTDQEARAIAGLPTNI